MLNVLAPESAKEPFQSSFFSKRLADSSIFNFTQRKRKLFSFRRIFGKVGAPAGPTFAPFPELLALKLVGQQLLHLGQRLLLFVLVPTLKNFSFSSLTAFQSKLGDSKT